MIARLERRFVGEKTQHLAFHQPVIETFGARLRQHRGRKIDADHPVADRPERQSGEPGAAAEIEHRTEFHAPPGLRGRDRAKQKLGRAVAQPFRQRLVEACGVAVEQRAHVTFRHGGGRFGAEPHKMQRGTVTILRVGHSCLRECLDSAGAVAQFFAQLAEHKPGRRVTGRKFERLHQQIGGAGKVALGFAVARPFKAAVGDQVAGRQVDRLELQDFKFPLLCVSWRDLESSLAPRF